MKKVYKGDFGYIENNKKKAIIRTAVFLGIVLILFLTGIFLKHTQKNVFSILAALFCLPTGWSGVNLIMFLKAKGCSKEDYDVIEAHRGNLLIHYDHIITSYEKNYYVAASTILDKNICCYTSDKDMDTSDCEKHIKKMMASSGYSTYSIKIFDDLKSFCDRLDQLEKLRSDKGIDPQKIEDSWEAGTVETPAGVLLSISL